MVRQVVHQWKGLLVVLVKSANSLGILSECCCEMNTTNHYQELALPSKIYKIVALLERMHCVADGFAIKGRCRC